jgi:DNA helicase II / ATP-dependent DNA helicase PcrA
MLTRGRRHLLRQKPQPPSPRGKVAGFKSEQWPPSIGICNLLLYWANMMDEPALARCVGERFDHVLVDEYQDTNALQAQILMRMKPDGQGLCVVGDDAQSIYSFRAATVRNILDFPKQFAPPAHVVTLEQNYRSTEPILEACNAVIAQAAKGFRKQLFSNKPSGERPQLVVAADEGAQVEYVVERVLPHREAGIDLNRQAVLFRVSHHSDQLEVELGRRGSHSSNTAG